MTTQEAYERIRAYFTRPGAQLAKIPRASAEDQDILGSRCLYRTPDGHACAVGCLIPEDYYSRDLEGRSARFVIERLRAVFQGVDVLFLQNAQRAHDSGATQTVADFVESLDALARRRGLVVPEGA